MQDYGKIATKIFINVEWNPEIQTINHREV